MYTIKMSIDGKALTDKTVPVWIHAFMDVEDTARVYRIRSFAVSVAPFTATVEDNQGIAATFSSQTGWAF